MQHPVSCGVIVWGIDRGWRFTVYCIRTCLIKFVISSNRHYDKQDPAMMFLSFNQFYLGKKFRLLPDATFWSRMKYEKHLQWQQTIVKPAVGPLDVWDPKEWETKVWIICKDLSSIRHYWRHSITILVHSTCQPKTLHSTRTTWKENKTTVFFSEIPILCKHLLIISWPDNFEDLINTQVNNTLTIERDKALLWIRKDQSKYCFPWIRIRLIWSHKF